MIVRDKLKKYIGAIENESVAGLLYDKYAIMIHGLQVSAIVCVHARPCVCPKHDYIITLSLHGAAAVSRR
jgi:hypothetical protein